MVWWWWWWRRGRGREGEWELAEIGGMPSSSGGHSCAVFLFQTPSRPRRRLSPTNAPATRDTLPIVVKRWRLSRCCTTSSKSLDLQLCCVDPCLGVDRVSGDAGCHFRQAKPRRSNFFSVLEHLDGFTTNIMDQAQHLAGISSSQSMLHAYCDTQGHTRIWKTGLENAEHLSGVGWPGRAEESMQAMPHPVGCLGGVLLDSWKSLVTPRCNRP